MQLLVSVVRRAFGSFRGPRWRRLAWTLAASLAAVVLVGAALLCGRTATGWMRAGQGGAQLIVYLLPDTEETARQSLVDDLAALGGVTHVELVDPAESLRRLRAALAGEQELLDGVEPETMPASIEAELSPGVDAVLPMSPTLSALRRHPAVEDVVIEPAPPDTLGAAMTGVAPWARSLTLLVAGLAALLCFAVARLAWAVPTKELAVARLLGAGPAFHLVPMALSAAVFSAAGALLGVIALLVGGLHVTGALAGSSGVATVAVLGAADAALLVLAAALIGGAGAARAAVAGEPTGG